MENPKLLAGEKSSAAATPGRKTLKILRAARRLAIVLGAAILGAILADSPILVMDWQYTKTWGPGHTGILQYFFGHLWLLELAVVDLAASAFGWKVMDVSPYLVFGALGALAFGAVAAFCQIYNLIVEKNPSSQSK